MKIYYQKDLNKLIDHIAAHYSNSGDRPFDIGVNETVKQICKVLMQFEKEKGIEETVLHQKFFGQ